MASQATAIRNDKVIQALEKDIERIEKNITNCANNIVKKTNRKTTLENQNTISAAEKVAADTTYQNNIVQCINAGHNGEQIRDNTECIAARNKVNHLDAIINMRLSNIVELEEELVKLASTKTIYEETLATQKAELETAIASHLGN